MGRFFNDIPRLEKRIEDEVDAKMVDIDDHTKKLIEKHPESKTLILAQR